MDVPNATLPVTGAGKDMERVDELIKKINPDTVFASQDSHYTLDIAHSSWWNDAKGNPVTPFTMIFADDIKNGKYLPRVDPKRSLLYVESLEANGEFNHFIWPDHCIMGTAGHCFHPTIFKAFQDWMKKRKQWVQFIVKGVNPFTEHFGIFRANVVIPEDANTQADLGIFEVLNNHDTVYLVGEARSHCVANSLKQLLEIGPQLSKKLVVIEDCMSDVPGLPADFYVHVDSIYADAKAKGVRFAKSTDI